MMKKDNLLFLIGGIAIGAVAGVFGSKEYWKKKFQDEADKEIDDLREYYGIKSSYQRSEIGKNYDNLSENAENGRENGVLSPEKRQEIKEKLDKNHAETTNYARIYSDKRKERANLDSQNDEKTDGFDQEIADDLDKNEEENGQELSDDDMEAKAIYDDHQANKDRKPRVISAETLNDLPEYYETRDLYYYSYDETITDENNEEVEVPELLLGDCMEKYDFVNNDEEVMYVQNFSFGKVFIIHKLFSSFT